MTTDHPVMCWTGVQAREELLQVTGINTDPLVVRSGVAIR